MTMMTVCGAHTSPSNGWHENVSPGAAPDAPAGLLDDISPPKEEIKFFMDHGPTPLGEVPGNEEEDDEDEFSQDDTSQASSAFSLPKAGVDPAAMESLLDPKRVCLVRMGCQVNGKTVPCVCGWNFPGCSRRSHTAKREIGGPFQMGEPGFYVHLTEPTAPKRADSCLDMGWHSLEGWLAIQEQAQDEREEVAHHLGSTMEEAKNAEPSRGEAVVAFGGVTYHRGSPPSRTEAWTGPSASTRAPETVITTTSQGGGGRSYRPPPSPDVTPVEGAPELAGTGRGAQHTASTVGALASAAQLSVNAAPQHTVITGTVPL